MSVIDSPDGQYGVVASQVLLASLPTGTATVTVTLPANVNTVALMLVDQPASVGVGVDCVGVRTGVQYPGTIRSSPPGLISSWVWYFEVMPSLDSEVEIGWNLAPTGDWYVVGMSGITQVDVPALTAATAGASQEIPANIVYVGGIYGGDIYPLGLDIDGNLKVVSSGGSSAPTYPDLTSGRVEMITNTATTIIAAPATGANYLFGIDFNNFTGSPGAMYCYAPPSNNQITGATPPTGQTVTVPLNGYRLTTALIGQSAVASNLGFVTVRYAIGP